MQSTASWENTQNKQILLTFHDDSKEMAGKY